MIKVITVCGNGIGSSNLLAMKISQLAKKMELNWMPDQVTLMEH